MKRDTINFKKYKKFAIMGGTFDPIHYGHLVAAEAVLDKFGMEKIIFIPTGNPTHKLNNKITESEHRYLMSVLATITNPAFDVSRIEIDREGITYTIDTIKEIKKNLEDDTEIFFITGADAVHEILTWKNVDELVNICSFIAVTRPGYEKEELNKRIEELKKENNLKISFLEIPALSISSTDIRNRKKLNKTIKYLLPEPVENYIYKSNLYNIIDEELEHNIKKFLKENLSEYRYSHSLRVAKEAVKIGELYKEYDNLDELYLAGLLHDSGKEVSKDEMENIMRKYDLSKEIKENINLNHSYISGEIAKDKFNIIDEKIINPIKYHIMGKPNMSILEKIIFIADYTEPERKNIRNLEKIRELVYNNKLDEGIILSIKGTIEHIENSNGKLNKDILKTLDFLESNKKVEELNENK